MARKLKYQAACQRPDLSQPPPTLKTHQATKHADRDLEHLYSTVPVKADMLDNLSNSILERFAVSQNLKWTKESAEDPCRGHGPSSC